MLHILRHSVLIRFILPITHTKIHTHESVTRAVVFDTHLIDVAVTPQVRLAIVVLTVVIVLLIIVIIVLVIVFVVLVIVVVGNGGGESSMDLSVNSDQRLQTYTANIVIWTIFNTLLDTQRIIFKVYR